MKPASQLDRPYKANFLSCQSALRVIPLGAKTTSLRCSHHLAAIFRQSAKLSAVHCSVAGLDIKLRLEAGGWRFLGQSITVVAGLARVQA